MKKQIFTLMLGAAVLGISPAFAMLEEDALSQEQSAHVTTLKNVNETSALDKRS